MQNFLHYNCAFVPVITVHYLNMLDQYKMFKERSRKLQLKKTPGNICNLTED